METKQVSVIKWGICGMSSDYVTGNISNFMRECSEEIEDPRILPDPEDLWLIAVGKSVYPDEHYGSEELLHMTVIPVVLNSMAGIMAKGQVISDSEQLEAWGMLPSVVTVECMEDYSLKAVEDNGNIHELRVRY